MDVTASAPGKVFVAGEYGVLVGGPAIVAAVGRRVRCRVGLEQGTGSWRIRGGGRSHTGTLATPPAEVESEVRFVAAAASVAARFLGLDAGDLTIETESELDRREAKRGLGGSAAVTAATVAAVFRAAGRGTDESDLAERTALGVEAHRLAQGSGSAADVVAATVGGLVLVSDLDVARVPESLAACDGTTHVRFERLSLPRSLSLEVVATRRPAASGPRARRFLDAAMRAPQSMAGATVIAWCESLRRTVLALAAACREDDATEAIAATAQAGRLLERLGALAGLPILTEELRTAARIAQESGAIAKVSGAGGGDCAIAIVPATGRSTLRDAWSRAGLEPLAVEIDADGARIDSPTGAFAGAAASPEATLRGGAA